MKRAVAAGDLRPGDQIRFDDRVWRVRRRFFEPPGVVDLDLVCSDETFNLHAGADDLFELVS